MSTDDSTVEKRTDAELTNFDGLADDCRHATPADDCRHATPADDCRPATPVHEPARWPSDPDGSRLRTPTANAEAVTTEAATTEATP